MIKGISLIVVVLSLSAHAQTQDERLIEAVMMENSTEGAMLIPDLIAQGANLNAPAGQNGRTALIVAACKNKTEILNALLENGADVNAMDRSGSTALMCAVGNNNLTAIRHLFAKEANPNLQNKFGVTALMTASADGRIEIVRMFIARQVHLNIQDNEGKTALMWAIEREHHAVQRALIRAKADKTLKDKRGRNALDYAKRHKTPRHESQSAVRLLRKE